MTLDKYGFERFILFYAIVFVTTIGFLNRLGVNEGVGMVLVVIFFIAIAVLENTFFNDDDSKILRRNQLTLIIILNNFCIILMLFLNMAFLFISIYFYIGIIYIMIVSKKFNFFALIPVVNFYLYCIKRKE